MTFNQGDVVLIPFPYTDLTGFKQRPALIVSNKNLNNTNDRICCLITSRRQKEGIKILDKDISKGELVFQCWVKPHRLFAVSKNIIRKKLCTVEEQFQEKMFNEILSYLKITQKVK
tara:strand:- start:2765 stop:3112 length:348 start_codon:yes stop_codon:yes gene_type:complete